MARPVFIFIALASITSAFAQETPPAGPNVGVKSQPTQASQPVSPPAENGTEVVQLEKFVTTETATGAEQTFNDKTSADSLTETVSGAALKNPTAQSATDLLKNVSGVSVTGGADGATKITVRGLDSRFLRVTVDGQRQGGGSNALDSLPPEIVQSLEVSKALTPDMDGDAIGGAINVTTGTANLKKSYIQGRHQITYNTLDTRPGFRNSATVAEPFAFFSNQPNAGFLLTASYDEQTHRRDQTRDFRQWTELIDPITGELVPVLTQFHLESAQDHRRRTAVVFNADSHWGPTAVFLRANVGRDWRQRNRQIQEFDPSAGVPVSLQPEYAVLSGVPQDRRDQLQTTQRDTGNFALGAKTKVGLVDADAVAGLSLTHESEPDTKDSLFRSTSTYRTIYDARQNFYLPQFTFVNESNPADTTAISDPADYRLNNLSISRTDTRDREGSFKFNARLNLDGDAQSNYLKFGGKIQQRHRDANTDRLDYDPGVQPLPMTNLVGASSVSMVYGGYQYGPIPDAQAVTGLLATQPNAFALNSVQTLINSTTADYQATETIMAAYGMGRFKWGRWTMITGARVESTRVASDGSQLIFNPSGVLQSITPVSATRTYNVALPGLHFRFDPVPGWLLRTSVTRALARPDYSDLVPQQQISFIDHRSRAGNPDLKPYEATNFDLSVDHYTASLGLVSLGVFFKKIDHFIADAQTIVTIGDLGQFNQFQRINGDSATVKGLETSWQSPAWSLPGTLGTASVQANYTLLQSETRFPGRPGEVFPLADQARHQGNVTLHFERKRFSGDATVRYRSKILEDIIAPGFDNYRIGSFDAEFSLAYKLAKDTRVTLGASNLLNRPEQNYSGALGRVSEYQLNGVDLTLGLQWKI